MRRSIIIASQERLSSIVEVAYDIVCKKIAGGRIEIYNETSLQLHLATILKSLGELYEFSVDEKGVPERFVIELEKPIVVGHTSKTNGVARCDIVLAFVRGENILAQAFIELKYFKKAKPGSGAEASKDNRFGLFMDLENLERYRSLCNKGETIPLCYEIAIAENATYSNPHSHSTIKTGNGCWTDDSRRIIKDGGKNAVHYVSHDSIDLQGNYLFTWTTFSEKQHCLIIRMQ